MTLGTGMNVYDRLRRVMTMALARGVARRSLSISLVVRTALTAINQADLLVQGAGFSLLKAALTYCVPYCVATYGAVSALLAQAE